eukprot:1610149-Rhodomonas_salina.2
MRRGTRGQWYCLCTAILAGAVAAARQWAGRSESLSHWHARLRLGSQSSSWGARSCCEVKDELNHTPCQLFTGRPRLQLDSNLKLCKCSEAPHAPAVRYADSEESHWPRRAASAAKKFEPQAPSRNELQVDSKLKLPRPASHRDSDLVTGNRVTSLCGRGTRM